jgi:hypothetical protein
MPSANNRAGSGTEAKKRGHHVPRFFFDLREPATPTPTPLAGLYLTSPRPSRTFAARVGRACWPQKIAGRAAEGAHPQTLRQKDRLRRKTRAQATSRHRFFALWRAAVAVCIKQTLAGCPPKGRALHRGDHGFNIARQRNLSGIEDRGVMQRNRSQPAGREA